MDLVSKPRTVFWEALFFGLDSPLKKFFASTSINFGLQVCAPQNAFENHVLKVKAVTKYSRGALTEFREFGQLLAYCYHFGIQDLHWQNILLTSTGPQVIDVEQVFSDLLLPNQTLMLPTEDLLKASAAINLITELDLENIGTDYAAELVAGFNEISYLIWNKASPINEELDALSATIQITPNRVFFRRTKDYVEYLQGTLQIQDLFEAERTQLERGDIPYFFMFIGGTETFVYTDASWATKVVQIPQMFLKFSSYAGFSPRELLQPKIIEARWARGSLYLMHKLKTLTAAQVKGDGFRLEAENACYRFCGPSQSFSMPKSSH